MEVFLSNICIHLLRNSASGLVISFPKKLVINSVIKLENSRRSHLDTFKFLSDRNCQLLSNTTLKYNESIYLKYCFTGLVMEKICVDSKCSSNWSIFDNFCLNLIFLRGYLIDLFTVVKIARIIYGGIIAMCNATWCEVNITWTHWSGSFLDMMFTLSKWIWLATLKHNQKRSTFSFFLLEHSFFYSEICSH